MKKIFQRLLVFVIGVPVVVALVAFFPWKHRLVMNFAVVAFSALGAVEMGGLLAHKGAPASKAASAVLGAIIPAAAAIVVSFDGPSILLLALPVLALLVVLCVVTFRKNGDFSNALPLFSSGVAALVYPGAFLSWICAMNLLPNSEYLIVCYLLMAFGNDSLAWVFGMLFGKNNRGLVKASPNKSIAGYAGGILTAMAVGALFACFLPQVFQSALSPAWVAGLILGFLVAVAGNLGDLAESALKRSAGVKDSGHLILGRGGVLDSVDSLCFAAPVFFLLIKVLFK
jgi:phosphatidate cytidylyltransferase